MFRGSVQGQCSVFRGSVQGQCSGAVFRGTEQQVGDLEVVRDGGR